MRRGREGGSRLFHPMPLPKVPSHTHPESQVTNLIADLAACEKTANKGAASGYAPLDATSKVPVANLPSLPESQVTNLTSDLAACEKTANKGAASGYAPLGANTLVPTARLGTGTADNTVFLRGDQTWAVPAGGGGSSGRAVCILEFASGDVSPADGSAVDKVQKIAPYLGNGAQGGRSVVWALRRLTFRTRTAPSSGTAAVNVQVYSGTGEFSGTDVMAADLVMSSGQYEVQATTFSVATVVTGDKLSMAMRGNSGGAAGWIVHLMMEEQ